MRISIVTPSFNQGHYLAETIESVIGQEGDFALDYLIIDGGSHDNSVSIIRHYEKLLAEKLWDVKCLEIKYRWISEADEGQTDAIMKGFRLAEGEILAWLNSDDTYEQGALRKIAQLFSTEQNVSVVYGKAHYVSEAGEVIGSYPTRPFDGKLLPAFNFICQPSVFFKKSAMQEVGGLDLSLNYVMDYDLWIRLAKKFDFHYLKEYLSTYRLHQQSKTIASRDALANCTEALDTVLKHYGWAPLNRVYVYCYQNLRQKFNNVHDRLLIVIALVMTIFKYFRLNRRIRFADLKMLNSASMRKLSQNTFNTYK